LVNEKRIDLKAYYFVMLGERNHNFNVNQHVGVLGMKEKRVIVV